MSNAFVCDGCRATYQGSPQTSYEHHLFFEQEPAIQNRRSATGIEVVLHFQATEKGGFSFRRGFWKGDPLELCPACLRKALKAVALRLASERSPISPARYQPKAIEASGKPLKHVRRWVREKRSDILTGAQA